jgi:hypothetical protein
MANRQFTTGGLIVVGTGALFLIDSFLPWHRECLDLFGNKTCYSESGWGTPFSLLATLLALALVAEVVAVQVLDQTLPAVGSFTWAQIRLAVAGVVLALVVLQLLVGDGGLSRSFGLFIGVLLAAGMLYGTLVRNRESAPATA